MLNSKVVLKFDQKLKGGWILEGNKLICHPHALFSPDTVHQIEAQGISEFGEPSDVFEYSFSTIYVEGKVWAGANLRDERIHVVTVYNGTALQRTMVSSRGTARGETPLGDYFILHFLV